MFIDSKKWCKFNPKYRYNDDAYFKKIIEFYLWNCPTSETTYDAKTFSEYGWIQSYHFKKLKKKCNLGSSRDINYITPTREDFYDTLKHYGQFNSHKFSEIVIIIKNNSRVSDFIRCIRNAFAHGSFMIHKHSMDKEYYYFLENRNPKNKQINARIVLKATTLISFIKNIKEGP